jgi:hypothetical protein
MTEVQFTLPFNHPTLHAQSLDVLLWQNRFKHLSHVLTRHVSLLPCALAAPSPHAPPEGVDHAATLASRLSWPILGSEAALSGHIWFLTINGERHYLWRAVDQDGNILDSLVNGRWDKTAAKRFFRKLLRGLTSVPRVIITDQLKSYGAALHQLLPSVEHRQHRYLNNRAENSYQPTRRRERRMQRFKSAGHAQRFLVAYGPIAEHIRPRCHLLCCPGVPPREAATIPDLAGRGRLGSSGVSVTPNAVVHLHAWSWP